LADGVEAIVRARELSTEEEIRKVIGEVFEEKLRTGQLAASELSIKDLNKVGDVFAKVLAGIYHSRIKYPADLAREKEAKNGEASQAQNGKPSDGAPPEAGSNGVPSESVVPAAEQPTSEKAERHPHDHS